MSEISKKDIEEYLDARESQLNNVLSSPIGTKDYSMPSIEEIDATIFLENEIETTENMLDILEDDDIIMKQFFGIK